MQFDLLGQILASSTEVALHSTLRDIPECKFRQIGVHFMGVLKVRTLLFEIFFLGPRLL